MFLEQFDSFKQYLMPPVFTHPYFILRFVDLLNVNAYPLMLFRMATRWAGARLELLVVLVITITNLMVVLRHGKISPSVAGLAISYAMQVGVLPHY